MDTPSAFQESDNPLGSVTLIGGGPGAWDLITVRGLRALEAADIIFTDHLGPGSQLDMLIDTSTVELVDVAKLPYGKQVSQERINEMLVAAAKEGKTVARLKGGDPFVFGRGFEELAYCAQHSVPCQVIPGVTSAVSVPGLAQIPVTNRGVVHAMTVVSGHLPPGHPRSQVDWEALAHSGATLVIIMGVRTIAQISEALIEAGMAESMPAAAVQDGSLVSQNSVRSTIKDLAADMEAVAIQAPAVIVIGEVAGLELPEIG